MDISIIIPVHRGGPRTFRLLDSIQEQQEAPEFEVILVANPPNETLRRQVECLPRVRYLATSVIGANNARNEGLKAAQGKILLFIDDDCYMHDRLFLRRHWLAHEQYPEISGLGGHYAMNPEAGAIASAYQRLQMSWIREAPQPGYRADLLLGGNMSFKREALSREKFEAALAFGGTETELVFRLASSGLRTKFLEEMPIQHFPDNGLLKFLLKAVKQGCGAAYLKRRNYHGVPLVTKGAQASIDAASWPVALLINLHHSFFRAGLAKEKFLGVWPEAQMITAGLWEAAKGPWRRLNYLLFVEVWGALRSAILLRKLGLAQIEASERDPGRRD